MADCEFLPLCGFCLLQRAPPRPSPSHVSSCTVSVSSLPLYFYVIMYVFMHVLFVIRCAKIIMWWYICVYVLRMHRGVHVCCIYLCKSVYVCMYKCMHDYKCVIIVYAWVYAWLCACMYILVYIRIGVCTYVFMCTCDYMYLVICYSDSDLFVRSEPCKRRPRPDLNLWSLWTRSLAIQKLTHRMIQRFVPVRTVETRRWFGSKTASFHVSVCLLVYFNFSILS